MAGEAPGIEEEDAHKKKKKRKKGINFLLSV